MSILLGIITSLMGSLGGAFRKKAAEKSTLPNGLFVLIGPLIGVIFIYSLVFILGINTEIFTNTTVVGLLIIAGIIDGSGSILEAGIYKTVKMSKILPYTSFDKLFIIVIGFILFYGNEGYTSITTLFISIFTVVVIIGFSIDFKKNQFDKNILKYIGIKVLYGSATLIIGSILLQYATMDVFAVIILVYLSFHLSLNILLRKNLKLIFLQSKTFYRYRLTSSTMGRATFVLGMFIVETSGVLVASLLSFITIVFSIISMKVILNDTPTKKQILLAFTVLILIGIGYYFK